MTSGNEEWSSAQCNEYIAEFVSRSIALDVPQTAIVCQIEQKIKPSELAVRRLCTIAKQLVDHLGTSASLPTKELLESAYRYSSVAAKLYFDQFRVLVEFLDPETYFTECDRPLHVDQDTASNLYHSLQTLFSKLCSNHMKIIDSLGSEQQDGGHYVTCEHKGFLTELLPSLGEHTKSIHLDWTSYINHLNVNLREECRSKLTSFVFIEVLRWLDRKFKNNQNMPDMCQSLQKMFESTVGTFASNASEVYFSAIALAHFDHKDMLKGYTSTLIDEVQKAIQSENTQLVVDLCACLQHFPLDESCTRTITALLDDCKGRLVSSDTPTSEAIEAYTALTRVIGHNVNGEVIEKISEILDKKCCDPITFSDEKGISDLYICSLRNGPYKFKLNPVVIQESVEQAVSAVVQEHYRLDVSLIKRAMYLAQFASSTGLQLQTWQYAESFGSLLVSRFFESSDPLYMQSWNCYLMMLSTDKTWNKERCQKLLEKLFDKLQEQIELINYDKALLGPVLKYLCYMAVKFALDFPGTKYRMDIEALAQKNESTSWDQISSFVKKVNQKTILPAVDKEFGIGYGIYDKDMIRSIYNILINTLLAFTHYSNESYGDHMVSIQNLLTICTYERQSMKDKAENVAGLFTGDITALDVIVSNLNNPNFQALLDKINVSHLTKAGPSYFGQLYKYPEILPINMAALTSGVSGVKCILDKTDKIGGCDSKGNILHTLALMYRSNPQKVMEIFNFLKEMKIDDLKAMMHEPDAYCITPIEKVVLRDGGELLEAMLQCYCTSEFKFNGGTRHLYNVTLLDSFGDENTSQVADGNNVKPLPMYMYSRVGENNTTTGTSNDNTSFRKCQKPSLFDMSVHSNRDKISCLESNPMSTLLKEKISAYMLSYIRLGIFHSVLMIFFTIFMLSDPLRCPFLYDHMQMKRHQMQSMEGNATKDGHQNATEEGGTNAGAAAHTVVRDVIILVFLCYSILIITSDIYDTVRHTILNKKNQQLLLHVFRPGPTEFRSHTVYGRMRTAWKFWVMYYTNFRLLFLSFAVCIFIYFVSIVSGAYYGRLWLSLSMILGWTCMLFFNTGNHMTIMLFRMASIVISFMLVFSCFLFGYSCAMYIMFRDTAGAEEGFTSFGDSLFTMFSVMVALTDIGVLDKCAHPAFCYAIYVAYVLTATILLLNMLIAVMSDAQSTLSSKRSVLWKQEIAMIIQLLERRLPKCCHSRPYLEKIDEQWFLSSVKTDVSVAEASTVADTAANQFVGRDPSDVGGILISSNRQTSRAYQGHENQEPRPLSISLMDIQPCMTSWDKDIHLDEMPLRHQDSHDEIDCYKSRDELSDDGHLTHNTSLDNLNEEYGNY